MATEGVEEVEVVVEEVAMEAEEVVGADGEFFSV